ncbi:unnamed protein product [Pseudo-nitzschia multistriata]|uniref:Uncharacterized protein n=1 Tax=Pseudo-nitzschia multistriata TaxID=183589 RepID=A0A448Z445_9STRA|nr:unnamed protein product [Pseudo-nitzschia multistriata]
MAKTTKLVSDLKAIGESLTKETLKDGIPSPARCSELVASIASIASEHKVTISVLEETRIGKGLTKATKVFRRHKRTADDADADEWEACIVETNKLLASLKEQVAREEKELKENRQKAARKEATEAGLPKTVSAYKSRLESQKKDMYKNPPAMPPSSIAIEEKWIQAPPKRNKTTGELTFAAGTDKSISQILKDFHPNLTPEEVLRAGSFGGTYFRPIVSAVTNVRYKSKDVLRDSVEPEWIEGLDAPTMLTSTAYLNFVNKFKVKCGGSLGMWESSGWISDADPYGWFQWYCRFYRGRRCADDQRQISRWLKSAGPKGRFRSQLCNKIYAAGGMCKLNDAKISPVIRQTMLHWGLDITADVLTKHGKRVGKIP